MWNRNRLKCVTVNGRERPHCWLWRWWRQWDNEHTVSIVRALSPHGRFDLAANINKNRNKTKTDEIEECKQRKTENYLIMLMLHDADIRFFYCFYVLSPCTVLLMLLLLFFSLQKFKFPVTHVTVTYEMPCLLWAIALVVFVVVIVCQKWEQRWRDGLRTQNWLGNPFASINITFVGETCFFCCVENGH